MWSRFVTDLLRDRKAAIWSTKRDWATRTKQPSPRSTSSKHATTTKRRSLHSVLPKTRVSRLSRILKIWKNEILNNLRGAQSRDSQNLNAEPLGTYQDLGPQCMKHSYSHLKSVKISPDVASFPAFVACHRFVADLLQLSQICFTKMWTERP